ncbi:metallophosphoesterase family protein [uncultured Clostridium sp.]|uniref:metallophosphoesterase family protein n=1 Tax=uncultured Clostridium sp. TaxID=59620 RepID=UPI0025D21023|nr:metallophosphoesterase family protein [uncultured Clostridium sp.]
MKIGVISDTHGLLRDEVIENLQGCDYIIHAGDIGSEEILDKLQGIAKTFAVRGNNDKEGYALKLPDFKEIKMDEVLIYVTHNKADIPKELREIDLIIYGHSHKYSEDNIDGIIYLNPGSCGRKRFSLPLSMAIVEVNLDNIEVKKIDIKA